MTAIVLFLINIELDHFIFSSSSLLEQLLIHFNPSSYLSSLDVTWTNTVRDERNLCRQIFRLPTFKYCKLFCENHLSHRLLSVATNEHGSIEYFAIKHR